MESPRAQPRPPRLHLLVVLFASFLCAGCDTSQFPIGSNGLYGGGYPPGIGIPQLPPYGTQLPPIQPPYPQVPPGYPTAYPPTGTGFPPYTPFPQVSPYTQRPLYPTPGYVPPVNTGGAGGIPPIRFGYQAQAEPAPAALASTPPLAPPASRPPEAGLFGL